MIGGTLRAALRPTFEWVTGGLQGKIYRAARRTLRRHKGKFPESFDLPVPIGRGLPERVIEIVLARLTYRPGAKLLDIGHANIMECHRRLLRSLPGPRHVTGIDIAEPGYDTRRYYEQSLLGDISSTGLPDASFDLIWCVSTLEHVGMDNSGYTAAFTTGEHLAAAALREMVRLLAPGGHLLVTVPYGAYENHGWHITYDATRWQAVLRGVKDQVSIREWYFHHTAAGWRRVAPEVLATVRYNDEKNAGAAGLAAALLTRHAGPAGQ